MKLEEYFSTGSNVSSPGTISVSGSVGLDNILGGATAVVTGSAYVVGAGLDNILGGATAVVTGAGGSR